MTCRVATFIPRRVLVHGHAVLACWFEAEQDPHKLLLLSCTVGRWDLLVIPPDTAPATAARLMATATDPSRTLTATGLIREGERFRTVAEEAADRDSLRERSGTPKADRPHLPRLRDGIRTIDVDLTTVTFCDVTGLNAFLHASRATTVADGSLRLHHPPPALARIIALTGNSTLLHGHPGDLPPRPSAPPLTLGAPSRGLTRAPRMIPTPGDDCGG